MTEKEIQDKAREYAETVVDEGIKLMSDDIYNEHIGYAEQCYIAGYTQAQQDLSKYKDALREIVKLYEHRNMGDLSLHEEEAINKAKQLLKE